MRHSLVSNGFFFMRAGTSRAQDTTSNLLSAIWYFSNCLKYDIRNVVMKKRHMDSLSLPWMIVRSPPYVIAERHEARSCNKSICIMQGELHQVLHRQTTQLLRRCCCME
jgi:hypothetical protein